MACTDLGTLGLVERWAADGRADEHGAQGSAAAVEAGAVCDPGRPGLGGTEAGDGDLGTMARVNQQGTALRTGAAQNLALPRTPCGPSPGSWSQVSLPGTPSL